MRHLALALFVDRRLLEANFFTDRWLALEPDSFDAINLKITICIDRGELRTAADSYNKMGPMRPASIEVARLRLMLYLRSDQISNAQGFAYAFIELPNLTPPDVFLVAEVGIRARDPVLVRAAAFRRGRVTYNQRVEPMLREVARLGLLRTFAARVGDP